MPVLSTGIDASQATKGASEFDAASKKIVNDTKEIVEANDQTNKSFMSIRDGIALGFGQEIFNKVLEGAQILAQFSEKTIKMASDLEETQNKFNVVFNGMEKEANEFSVVLQKAYAMSETEGKKFLSSVQDLLVPMGFARQQAGGMSFEIVKLAADLGSFNNLPTADVMENITSALTGEYEGMKKYGIVINETAIQQEALNLGLATNKNQIDQTAKAQAAFSLMVKGSSDAIGDMARSSDSYANTLKGLNAGLDDMQTKIGQQLLPIATSFLKSLKDWVTDQNNVNTVVNVTVSVLQGLYNGFQGIRLALYGLNVIVASVFDAVYQKIMYVLTPLDSLFDAMVKLGGMESNPLKNLQKITEDWANSSVDAIKNVWQEVEKQNLKFEQAKIKTTQLASTTNQLTATQQKLVGTVSLTNAGIKTATDGMNGFLTAEQIADAQTKGISLSMGAFYEKTEQAASALKGDANPALQEANSIGSQTRSIMESAGSGYESLANSTDTATESLNRFTQAQTKANSASGGATGNRTGAWNTQEENDSIGGVPLEWYLKRQKALKEQAIRKSYGGTSLFGGGTYGPSQQKFTENGVTYYVFNGNISRQDMTNVISESQRQTIRY